MENSEIWKPVVGYEDTYQVSDLGRVRRVKAAQGTRVGWVLTPIKGKRGYLSVHLHSERSRRLVRIHRIVAEAFHGVSDLPLVRHLDGNPENNVPSNLAHGTAQENANDRVAHGRQYLGNQNSQKTHCKNGHGFTPENTKMRRDSKSGRMSRRCRICLRAMDQRKYWRDKAKKAA